MVKALVVAVISLLLCGVASADWTEDLEILKAEIKPCSLYSITENQATYAMSAQLLGFRGFELNGIYCNDKNMPAIGLGYELTNLEKLGIDVPLAKYCTLSAGGYVGSREFTSENRSTDWGIWATLIKITF